MSVTRRTFLGTTLSGLLASPVLGATAFKAKYDDASSFDPDVMFLTWHRDPTTTMDVLWVAAKGVSPDTAVYYLPLAATEAARHKESAWKKQASLSKPHPMCDLTIYRAHLSGLEPGTDYLFHISKDSPQYRFRTMPAKATDVIEFISGGDCGVNQHMIDNCVQAARQDPMFALIGGDLGYDNGVSVDVNLAFYRNYRKTMIGRDGRLIPMVTCIGNHEVRGGFKQTRDKASLYYSMFGDLFPDSGYATLDFGDYLSLVLLDTDHTTPIGGAQTDWLEKTLRARVDHPHVFAVNHVPSYPSARRMGDADGVAGTGEDSRKFWVPLFDKYRLPVVLEHHDHTFKRSKLLLDNQVNDNGVLYLGDGSWGRIRAPLPPAKLPLLARVSENFHLSLHRLEGDQRFHMAFDENGAVMDVCRSGQRKQGLL